MQVAWPHTVITLATRDPIPRGTQLFSKGEPQVYLGGYSNTEDRLKSHHDLKR